MKRDGVEPDATPAGNLCESWRTPEIVSQSLAFSLTKNEEDFRISRN